MGAPLRRGDRARLAAAARLLRLRLGGGRRRAAERAGLHEDGRRLGVGGVRAHVPARSAVPHHRPRALDAPPRRSAVRRAPGAPPPPRTWPRRRRPPSASPPPSGWWGAARGCALGKVAAWTALGLAHMISDTMRRARVSQCAASARQGAPVPRQRAPTARSRRTEREAGSPSAIGKSDEALRFCLGGPRPRPWSQGRQGGRPRAYCALAFAAPPRRLELSPPSHKRPPVRFIARTAAVHRPCVQAR